MAQGREVIQAGTLNTNKQFNLKGYMKNITSGVGPAGPHIAKLHYLLDHVPERVIGFVELDGLKHLNDWMNQAIKLNDDKFVMTVLQVLVHNNMPFDSKKLKESFLAKTILRLSQAGGRAQELAKQWVEDMRKQVTMEPPDGDRRKSKKVRWLDSVRNQRVASVQEFKQTDLPTMIGRAADTERRRQLRTTLQWHRPLALSRLEERREAFGRESKEVAVQRKRERGILEDYFGEPSDKSTPGENREPTLEIPLSHPSSQQEKNVELHTISAIMETAPKRKPVRRKPSSHSSASGPSAPAASSPRAVNVTPPKQRRVPKKRPPPKTNSPTATTPPHKLQRQTYSQKSAKVRAPPQPGRGQTAPRPPPPRMPPDYGGSSPAYAAAYGGGVSPAYHTQSSSSARGRATIRHEPHGTSSYQPSRQPPGGGVSPHYRSKPPIYGGKGGKSPNYGSKSPNYGGKSPNYGGKSPNYGSKSPNYGGKSPNYGGKSPNYGGKSPNYGNKVPNVPGKAPPYGGQPPKTHRPPNHVPPRGHPPRGRPRGPPHAGRGAGRSAPLYTHSRGHRRGNPRGHPQGYSQGGQRKPPGQASSPAPRQANHAPPAYPGNAPPYKPSPQYGQLQPKFPQRPPTYHQSYSPNKPPPNLTPTFEKHHPPPLRPSKLAKRQRVEARINLGWKKVHG